MATATSESNSGWQEVDFDQPVLIQANQVYVAAYLASAGHYSDNIGFFAGGSHASGPLTALGGVYQYTGSTSFPSNSYQNSNYWVDVVLTSLVGSVSPAAGSIRCADEHGRHREIHRADERLDGHVDFRAASGFVGNRRAGLGRLQCGHSIGHAHPDGGLERRQDIHRASPRRRGGRRVRPASTLTGNYTSTFTTAATVPNGVAATSLWHQSTTPNVTDNPDSQAVELGMRFQSSVAGLISGLAFYKSANNTGTHTADLWSSDGKLLATATFTNETASGWQLVMFAQPVPIQANTVYVASYHTSTGHYADDQTFFASSGLTVGSLTAVANSNGGNGVYAYGAGGIFPTQTFNASNYWVDVLFVPSN